MKRAMRKAVVVLIALSLIAAFCVTASATEVSTITKYTIADGNVVVAVESNVTGVAAGDQVTYLAYKNGADASTLTDDQIVYVSQKEATGTSVTFSYQTDEANKESEVLVGGSAIATAIDDQYKGYIATVTVDAETPVNVPVYGWVNDADASLEIPTSTLDLTGKTVSAVAVDGTPVNFVVSASSIKVPGMNISSNIAVTVTTTPQAGTIVLRPKSTKVQADGSDLVVSTLGINTTAGTEYGMMLVPSGVTPSASNVVDILDILETDDYVSTNSVKLPADATGADGYFAVSLTGVNNLFSPVNVASYTVYAYAYVGGDYELSSQSKSYDLSGVELQGIDADIELLSVDDEIDVIGDGMFSEIIEE